MPVPTPGQAEIPTQRDRLGATSMAKPLGVKLTRFCRMPYQQRWPTMPWAVLAKRQPAREERDPTPPFSTCLFSLEKGRQWGELIAACIYLRKRRHGQALPRDLQ